MTIHAPISRRVVNNYFHYIGRSYGQEMKVLGGLALFILFIGWLFKI